MPDTRDYSDITPVDLKNPFRNPTEEPDYSPDYRAIMPELDLPDSKIPLFPAAHERSAIKRYFALTFLTLLFALLTAMTIYVALQGGAGVMLRQVDLRKLGELPQNYTQILQQYLTDSSIAYAINLISFLCGNLAAFFIGCKLTDLKPKTLFRLRNFTVPRAVCYVFIGLWIQLVAGLLGEQIIRFAKTVGLTIYVPDTDMDGTFMRMAMLGLYACIIAPVTEELLMRGLVLKNLSRVSQRLAILLSAFLFALMHENLLQFLFTFPLGILLGYITIRHNSVTPAIIVHIGVNTFGVAISLCERFLSQGSMRIVNISYTLGILLIGAVALLYLLFTERLPDQTPHQSMRAGRLVAASPLFWILFAVHVGAALLAGAGTTLH